MVQKTGSKPPLVVMPEPSHCVTALSPLATMIGEILHHPPPGTRGKWYTALFVHFIPPVPHTDTDPRTVGDSVKLRSIMRFGLLLLSCRGEGLQ
ncbi:hypothetical protein GCM10010297_53860 [Streptomyces malachitofuscus]|nr:hypothetical protein GCM10010297_53860 [Streptomyces malachitofuscus]